MASTLKVKLSSKMAVKALVICVWFVSLPSSVAAPKKGKEVISSQIVNELRAKDDALSEKIEELEAHLEVMQEQYRLLVQKTSLTYLNQFYIRGGITLISPRLRGSGINGDPGTGGFLGLGQYFGRNHVADLAFEWDIYPSISLRYRYEFHYDNPLISFGPVVGVKLRALDGGPMDGSIDRPDLLKGAFAMVGATLGVPLGRVLFALEMVYLFPRQNFFLINLGATFFLF